MPSILGRTWTINVATAFNTPFAAGDTVEITKDATVKWGGHQWQGRYLEAEEKVVVEPADDPDANDTHWELVGSELFNGKFIMYGSSWTTTLPDAMGAWVSDPQGGPAASGDEGGHQERS